MRRHVAVAALFPLALAALLVGCGGGGCGPLPTIDTSYVDPYTPPDPATDAPTPAPTDAPADAPTDAPTDAPDGDYSKARVPACATRSAAARVACARSPLAIHVRHV